MGFVPNFVPAFSQDAERKTSNRVIIRRTHTTCGYPIALGALGLQQHKESHQLTHVRCGDSIKNPLNLHQTCIFRGFSFKFQRILSGSKTLYRRSLPPEIKVSDLTATPF